MEIIMENSKCPYSLPGTSGTSNNNNKELNQVLASTMAGITEHTIGHIPRTIIDYKQFTHSKDANHYLLLYNQGGIPRFFKGIVPMLSGVSFAHVALFSSLEYSKKYESFYSDFVFGIIGKVSHDLFMVPGDIIRLRSNITNKSSINTVKDIYSSFGLRGFYKGSVPNFCMNIPSGIIEFTCHNYLERKFGNNGIQPLITGLATGVSSTMISTPIDTIKTCMQCDGIGNNKYNNISDTIKVIYRKRGISGFFRGASLRCIQTTACFTIYDLMNKKNN